MQKIRQKMISPLVMFMPEEMEYSIGVDSIGLARL